MNRIKELLQHKGFMKYSINTSWLFSEKILRMGIGLLVGVWVARYLGPDRFGLLSYAQSFVGLFLAISTLGLDSIIIREIVKGERGEGDLLGTAWGLKIMGACAVFLTLGISMLFSGNDVFTNILIFIIASSTIFQSFNILDCYFQSKVLSKFAVWSNFIAFGCTSILKIVLIIMDAPLIAFAWGVLFESVILAMGFCYFYIKNNTLDSFKSLTFSKITAIALLKDSWPLILTSIVISVYMKIDQVMVKKLLDNNAVGQYAVAVQLSEAWYFIPVVVSKSLFPAILNAKKESETLFYERVQRLYDLMVWLAIGIALPMSFLSNWCVTLLYGAKFQEAGSVLAIHIWAGVLVFFGVVRHLWVLSLNLQKYEMILDIVGAISNIILNIILIPKYHILGAAYATIISYFMGTVIASIFIKPLHVSLYMYLKAFLFPLRFAKKKYSQV